MYGGTTMAGVDGCPGQQGQIVGPTSVGKRLWLPPVLAMFALEKPRTAFEMYEKVVEMAAAEDSVLEDTDVEFVKLWFIAVPQDPQTLPPTFIHQKTQ